MKILYFTLSLLSASWRKNYLKKKLLRSATASLATTLFLCVTLSLPKGVLAQANLPELRFDSLIRANENYKTEDLKKLKLLNLPDKGYPAVNSTKGIETSDEAITLAQKLRSNPAISGQSEHEQAAALHYKAGNVFTKGDAKQALTLYEQAMTINEKHNNQYGISENLRGVGKVNIIEFAYELVKNNFTCEFRGEIEAKGKGKVKMYFAAIKE